MLCACATMPSPSHPGERYWQGLSPDAGGDVPEIEARLSHLFQYERDAASCATHRAALEHAIERLPIDLYSLRTALECASLLGDIDWQVRTQRQLDALVDFAFRDGRGTREWAPAPVLNTYDIGVLAEQRGLTLQWVRYVGLYGWRFLLVEASAVDAAGVERRYYFDLLDAMLRLAGDDLAEYPESRAAVARARMEADALNGDALALTGHLYMDTSTGEVASPAAVRALTLAWESDLPGAAITLVELCLSDPEADCDDARIDTLIEDLKQREIAEGWALDAARRIVRGGHGADDPEVAEALLRAGQRADPGRMTLYTAAVLRGSGEPLNDAAEAAVEPLLRRAAADGAAEAHLLLLQVLPEEQRKPEHPAARAHIDALADAGHPRGQFLRAVALGLESDAGFRSMFEAFRADLPEAQFLMALTLADAAVSPRLLREAAYGGHVGALLILSQQALTLDEEPDLEAARAWLYAGLSLDNLEATARLAALLWLHPELEPDNDEAALELVRLLREHAGADAALRVADILLDVEPYNRDVSAGIGLLKRLSRDGFAEATLELAGRRAVGDGLPEDLAAASNGFELAARQGSVEADYLHAVMQWFDRGDMVASIRYYERAARAGHENAANDLAWVLCTGQGGAEIDALRGLFEIEALLDRLDEPHPFYLSTLAACQAQLGDFEHARRNHRRALERALRELPEETDAHADMRERMTLYENDRPYIAD